MKQLLFLHLLLFSIPIFAQQSKKLDSLKAIFAKLPTEGRAFASDTTRVRVLCELGEIQMSSDTCMYFFSKALNLAQKNDWKKGEATAYNFIGKRLKKQNNFFKAQEAFYKGLDISETIGEMSQVGYALQNIGDVFTLTSKLKEALKYYEQAIKVYKKINYPYGILLCINNTGIAYEFVGQYDNSLAAHRECLKINKLYKIKRFDALSYHNIGHVYKKKGLHDEAIKFLEKGLEEYKSIGKSELEQIAVVNQAIAEVYLVKNDLVKAKYYVKNALEINNNSITSTKLKAYNVLLKIAEKEGKYDISFFYSERIRNIQDSLTVADNDRKLRSTKFEYELSKSQENLKNETERKRKMYFIGFFFFLVGVFALGNNYLLSTKNKKIAKQKKEIDELNDSLEIKVAQRTQELTKANEELLRKNEEIIQALVDGQTLERKRVATELHDNLGSMLSGMKFRLQALDKNSLSEPEQRIYDSILLMMEDAYSEVRLISHNLLPAELENNGLIGALQKLASDFNLSNKITVSFNYPQEAIFIDAKISIEFYSICQELLNNAIKHSKATNVDIIFKVEDNQKVFLIVKDNGIGINHAKKNGMGLKNLENRVKSLNGELLIYSEPMKGTMITIVATLNIA